MIEFQKFAKNEIVKRILKFRRPEKLILAGLVYLLLAFFLYCLMLAPYVKYHKSLNGELRTQKDLYNFKTSKVSSLEEIKNRYKAGLEKLDKTYEHFFTEDEVAIFLRDLPVVAGKRGLQIISVKPGLEGKNLRSEAVAKFVEGLYFPEERKKEVLTILDKNRTRIDSGQSAEDILREIVGKVPADKIEQLRSIWYQGAVDSLAFLKLQRLSVSIEARGGYQGLVALFDWLNSLKKIIELSDLQIVARGEDGSVIEVLLTLKIYVLKL